MFLAGSFNPTMWRGTQNQGDQKSSLVPKQFFLSTLEVRLGARQLSQDLDPCILSSSCWNWELLQTPQYLAPDSNSNSQHSQVITAAFQHVHVRMKRTAGYSNLLILSTQFTAGASAWLLTELLTLYCKTSLDKHVLFFPGNFQCLGFSWFRIKSST